MFREKKCRVKNFGWHSDCGSFRIQVPVEIFYQDNSPATFLSRDAALHSTSMCGLRFSMKGDNIPWHFHRFAETCCSFSMKWNGTKIRELPATDPRINIFIHLSYKKYFAFKLYRFVPIKKGQPEITSEKYFPRLFQGAPPTISKLSFCLTFQQKPIKNEMPKQSIIYHLKNEFQRIFQNVKVTQRGSLFGDFPWRL